MANPTWNGVALASINENGQVAAKYNHTVSIIIEKTGNGAKITASKGMYF